MLDGKAWSFQRHGSGVSFSDEREIIVDANDRLSEPDVFDAWRIMQYVESFDRARGVEFQEIEEREVVKSLDDLTVSGQLERVGNRHYRILNRS